MGSSSKGNNKITMRAPSANVTEQRVVNRRESGIFLLRQPKLGAFLPKLQTFYKISGCEQ